MFLLDQLTLQRSKGEREREVYLPNIPACSTLSNTQSIIFFPATGNNALV